MGGMNDEALQDDDALVNAGLLPCPFCGGKGALWTDVHAYGSDEDEVNSMRLDPERPYRVECETCSTCGPQVVSAEEAVRLWNKRVVS